MVLNSWLDLEINLANFWEENTPEAPTFLRAGNISTNGSQKSNKCQETANTHALISETGKTVSGEKPRWLCFWFVRFCLRILFWCFQFYVLCRLFSLRLSWLSYVCHSLYSDGSLFFSQSKVTPLFTVCICQYGSLCIFCQIMLSFCSGTCPLYLPTVLLQIL